MRFYLDNPNLKIRFLTEITRNFSGFVLGTGGNNSLAVFNPEVDIVKKQLEGKDDSENSETSSYNIKLDVMSRIMDSSLGAFFINDMLHNSDVYAGVKNLNNQNLDQYITFLHEDMGANMSEVLGNVILSNYDSIKHRTENPATDSSGHIKLEPGSMKEAVKYIQKTEAPVEADGNSSQNEQAKESYVYFCNGEQNQAPAVPSLSSPSLGAVVIKDPYLSIQSKNSNYLSVFFNAIPQLEMMKCTPFIKLTFYEKNFRSDENDFLNPTAYMRFVKQGDGSGFVLDDNLGLGQAKEKDTPTHTGAANAQASYMNVFTSPQTLNNANINNDFFSSFGNDNKKSPFPYVLEPFAPMLSLQTLSIGITGGGFGLTSSKRANMTVVLHDRSRMKDIAPLVSVNQFVNTIVKIEFGWSHPEGNFDAGGDINNVGYFLNSLRDVSFYTLNSSDIRFEGSVATINVKMTALGSVEHKIVPASCGRLAPLSVLRGQILSAIDSLSKNKSSSNKESEIVNIHQPLEVLRDSVLQGFAAVDSIKYREFLDQIRKEEINDSDVIRSVLEMFEIDEQESSAIVSGGSINKNRMTELVNQINNAAITRINKDEILKKYEDLKVSPDYFSSPRSRSRLSYLQQATRITVQNAPTHASYSRDSFNPINTVSLGSLMCAYVGAPMLSTGEYSEVQMFFHPINSKAGGGRIHTTASFPILKTDIGAGFKKLFEGENDRAQFLTVKSIVEFFSEILESQNEIFLPGGYDLGVSPSEFLSGDGENTGTVDELLEEINSNIDAVISTYIQQSQGDTATGEKIRIAYEKNKVSTASEEEIDLLNTAVASHFNIVSSEKETEILKEIYAVDGMYVEDVNSLVKPIIRVAFETLPAVDPTPSITGDSGQENILGRVLSRLSLDEESETEKTGYYGSSKIMRVHIYDANASAAPNAELINSIINSNSIETGGENTDNNSNNSSDSFLKNIVDFSLNGRGDKNPIKVPLDNVTPQDLKAYVKRHFPSITYGSANSVVTNVSITSTTNDKIAQGFFNMYEAQRRAAEGGGRTSVGPTRVMTTGVTVFPATISVEIMGMPFASMGNQIYVDLGTSTDLDNVYAVYNVTHTIQSGKFVTKLDMKLSNQAMTRNIKGDIAKSVKRLINVEN